MSFYESTPNNAFWKLDTLEMDFYNDYDGNSLLYLSGLDPDDAELGDIYTELVSCHETLASCLNLLIFADMFLCILLGCLMASIFSRFWRFNK